MPSTGRSLLFGSCLALGLLIHPFAAHAFGSAELAELARLISPEQAESMLTRIHEKYPTLHQELWAQIQAAHPSLERDVTDAVLHAAPDVYARTDVYLRQATTDSERLAILRDAALKSPEARSAVLDTINTKHPGVYATVFSFIATEYPGVVIEVASAWWNTRETESESGGA